MQTNENVKDSYFTIKLSGRAELKIQKSKFIGEVFHAGDRAEAQAILEGIKKKYYDAGHSPFAFRLGINGRDFRHSDDGEPSGSSGKPILEVVSGHNLTDLIAVVTRYFGGVKLGVGGLRRAYGEAAEAAVNSAVIEEKFVYEKINAAFPYKYMNVIMRLIDEHKIKIAQNVSDDSVRLVLESRLSKTGNFIKQAVNLTNGEAVILTPEKLT